MAASNSKFNVGGVLPTNLQNSPARSFRLQRSIWMGIRFIGIFSAFVFRISIIPVVLRFGFDRPQQHQQLFHALRNGPSCSVFSISGHGKHWDRRPTRHHHQPNRGKWAVSRGR